MPFLLATVAQFKTFQKGDIPSSMDSVLTQLLQGLTASFATHCRRQTWDKTAFTEYFSHRRHTQSWHLLSVAPPFAQDTTLYVRHPPIDTAQAYALYDDPARVFGEAALIPTTDYVIEAEAGKVELDGRSFMPGLQSTKLTYTGGYLSADGTSTNPKFPDLHLLCLIQAGFLYQRRAELGLTGRSLEGGSMSLMAPVKFLPQVEDGLRHFRPPRVG